MRQKSVLWVLSKIQSGANVKVGVVKVTSTKELGPAKMMGVDVNGKSILLVNLDGKYYAIGNVCTHLGCRLSDGILKEETVQCPCHCSVFNVKTGEVINGIANKPEPSFQVKVDGDQILVSV
jgi:nitrite reductase/ring-hydroxylating ferredoxin subunit